MNGVPSVARPNHYPLSIRSGVSSISVGEGMFKKKYADGVKHV